MNDVNEDIFLDRLYEVVNKLSGIAKMMGYRFENLWNAYLGALDYKPHLVRKIPLEEERFKNDLDYRISTLQTVADSMVDGFYTIQSILKALYDYYFDSDPFTRDFPDPDEQMVIKYYAAREILGNLIQYNKMDHTTVPLKYNIIARNYIMMKLKGLSLTDIIDSLAKLNKVIEKDLLIRTLEEIKDDGIIDIKPDGDSYFITLKKELKLSEVGKKKLNESLRPIIDWPTQFWRSYYNIRELNLTPTTCDFSDFLCKILSKSATQGMSPAHYVFNNLVKYYEKIKEQT